MCGGGRFSVKQGHRREGFYLVLNFVISCWDRSWKRRKLSPKKKKKKKKNHISDLHIAHSSYLKVYLSWYGSHEAVAYNLGEIWSSENWHLIETHESWKRGTWWRQVLSSLDQWKEVVSTSVPIWDSIRKVLVLLFPSKLCTKIVLFSCRRHFSHAKYGPTKCIWLVLCWQFRWMDSFVNF